MPSRSGTEDGRRGGGQIGRNGLGYRSLGGDGGGGSGSGPPRRDLPIYDNTRQATLGRRGTQCPDAIGVIYPEGGGGVGRGTPFVVDEYLTTPDGILGRRWTLPPHSPSLPPRGQERTVEEATDEMLFAVRRCGAGGGPSWAYRLRCDHEDHDEGGGGGGGGGPE